MANTNSFSIEDHNIDVIWRFASDSYLSNAAYDIALQNQCGTLQTLCADGSWQSFQVTPLISRSNSAFKAYVLTPEDPSRNDVKVIFRGTEVRTNDRDAIESVKINLEADSAGSELWAVDGVDILKQFKEVVANAGFAEKEIIVEISGHSQGGALSQYFTTELMFSIYLGETHNVAQIHNSAFNSTGIDSFTSEIFRAIFPALAEQYGYDFFQSHIGYTHGDPVQQTGESTIWEHIDPAQAFVEMVLVDKGLKKAWAKDINFDDGLQVTELAKAIYKGIIGAMKAHENDGYFAPNAPGGPVEVKFPYKHISNQNDEGYASIQKELEHKLYMTQTLLKPFKIILHDLLFALQENSKDNSNYDQTSTKEPLLFSDVLNESSTTNLANEVFHNQMSGLGEDPLDHVMWNNTLDIF